MLNGVDLTARRELAGILTEQSWEAQLATEVEATAGPAGRAELATRVTRLGGSRIARPFRFPLGGDGRPGPVDAVLAALGCCAVTEAAVSLTEHGRMPDRLDAEVTLRPDGTVGCALRIDGDVSGEVAAAVLERTTTRSTALRTVAGANSVTVSSLAGGRFTGAAADCAAPLPAAALTARWQTGSRVTVTRPGDDTPLLEADQPKQLFGADRAPSPHEYLLAALAAEAAGFGGEGDVVCAAGRIDLRGPLAVGDAPVGLRDLLVQFLAAAGPEGPRRWLAEGPALRLLLEPRPVDVAFVPGGAPLGLTTAP